jgi:imidazolonepropionase
MSELITDIGELTTHGEERTRLHDAALVIDGARIAWIGSAGDAPAS